MAKKTSKKAAMLAAAKIEEAENPDGTSCCWSFPFYFISVPLGFQVSLGFHQVGDDV